MKNIDFDFFEEDEFIDADSIDERTIFILGEINDSLFNTAIIPIMKLNKKEKNFKTHEPIKIYINSPGGNLYAAFALIDVMRTSEIPIHVTVMGFAASAAFMIMCAGHKRSVYKNSSLLLHEPSWGLSHDKLTTLKSNIKQMNRVEDMSVEFYTTNTCVTEAMYRDNASKEWWMDPKEALKLKCIDEII